MTTTKAQLVKKVQQKHGNISRREALIAVDKIWSIIKQNLAKDEVIQINGFGKFIVRSQAPRVGRNINIGQPVPIPATKTVVFRPSDRLKLLVNDH
jgi:nucleoid DNA-binding protein